MRRQVELRWQEVTWHRPFELEDVHDLLTHMAATSPRGPVIWEIRGNKNGVRFLIGTDRTYSHKVQNLFRSHGNIQFTDASAEDRATVTTAKQLKATRPILSLKTDTALSVIRSALFAISRYSAETVLQVLFGPTSMPTPTRASALPTRWPRWNVCRPG